MEVLRDRADREGVPAEYFEDLKTPDKPMLDEEPSGAMMGRRWLVSGETGSGYTVWAGVDASDGVVRSFSWSIPGYGKPIEPVKKRPSDDWFLTRAREYEKAMGVNAPLKIDRIEPDSQQGYWGVWLTQTYEGIPVGDGYLVVDGRYGLLSHAVFWPTPNPPRSVKPKIDAEKARALGLAWVRETMQKGQALGTAPFDPSRMSLGSEPRLIITRSDESERLIKTSRFNEHSADRLPGMLVYGMTIGVESSHDVPSRKRFFEHRFGIQIDASNGRVVSTFDITPGMMG
jgi:hypothetical protein